MRSVQDIPAIERPPTHPPARDSSGRNNLIPANSASRSVKDYSPPPTSSAIWVLIAAIIMSFAAFSSALIVREGGSLDWRHLPLPRILYFNTFVLILSSIALGKARRRFVSFRRAGIRQETNETLRWLYATLILGLIFVAGQWTAWMQLRSQGIYLATNPNSSFFYLLTVAHVVHVVGGLVGLLYVIRKLRRAMLQRSTLDAVSRYWHFVDLLWVYLLFLLWIEI